LPCYGTSRQVIRCWGLTARSTEPCPAAAFAHENQLPGSDLMRWTRLSLFYVAGYLLPAGVGLLFAPQIALRLLLSDGDYGNIFPPLAGMFLLGLFIIVVQLIRLRAEFLYQTTIIVRGFFCVCLGSFYYISRDPLFLVMLGIVAFGLLLTASCYAVEHKTPGIDHRTAGWRLKKKPSLSLNPDASPAALAHRPLGAGLASFVRLFVMYACEWRSAASIAKCDAKSYV